MKKIINFEESKTEWLSMLKTHNPAFSTNADHCLIYLSAPRGTLTMALGFKPLKTGSFPELDYKAYDFFKHVFDHKSLDQLRSIYEEKTDLNYYGEKIDTDKGDLNYDISILNIISDWVADYLESINSPINTIYLSDSSRVHNITIHLK